MKISIPYGRSGIDLEVPDDALVIEPCFVPGIHDEAEAARHALQKPISAPRLRDLALRGSRIAIVINDITRPTPSHRLVPWILEELDFIPLEDFIIINGTGSHRANTPEELTMMLGRGVTDSVKVINHDATDHPGMKHLGRTGSGTEVWLNREYCDADLRVVTGFIEPHFFAGFSGGPKGVMPAVAGIETIMGFHRPELISNPGSTWGMLQGNPLQEEAVEIAMMQPPEFLLNVTMNVRNEITGFYAGDMLAAHRRGAQEVRKQSMIRCEGYCDIVVTSNSGYPLDQNLYQCVKGFSAACQIVRPGGAILCCAECSDGIPGHGNFSKILGMRDTPGQLLDMIMEPSFSMQDQWQVQKLAMIQEVAHLHLCSGLEDNAVKAAGIVPWKCPDDALKALLGQYGREARVCVLPDGPLSIPFLR